MSARFGLETADRSLDAAVLLFAGWTLLVHRVVVEKGTLFSLLQWSLPTLIGIVGIILWIWIRGRSRVEAEVEGFGRPDHEFRESLILSAGVFGITGLWILIWFPALAWTYGVAVLGLYTVVGIREGAGISEKPRPAGILFVGVLVVAVGLTMTVKRPDIDDSYYLGMAVSVKESGEKPLLCCDFVHLRDDLPIRKPSDQLRSFEVLLGVVAYLSHTAPIIWAHVIFPFFGAILAVVATSRLLRILLPRRWSWALLAWLVILVSVGNAHGWYGNMAFVRLHQGKSLLVTVLLPALWVYALEFSKYRSLPSWILLFAANIAAMGLNPSGIWLAPLATVGGMMAGLDWRNQASHAILGGVLATSYSGLMGLSIRSEMEFFMEKSVGETTSADLLESASDLVMGKGILLMMVVASLALIFGFLKRSAPKRFILATVVVFLTLCNPQWARWVARYITGGWTFWRVFWLVPIPLFMALGIVSLGRGSLNRWPAIRRRGNLVGITLVLLCIIPGVWSLSTRTKVHWGLGLKVPTVEYRLAEYVMTRTPLRGSVLAPPSVSSWIATFEHRPNLLVIRQQYLRPDLSYPHDLRIRRWLLREVNRPKLRVGGRRKVFFDFLSRYEIDILVFRSVRKNPRQGRRAYKMAGYELKVVRQPYEIWIRKKEIMMITPPEAL